MRTVAGLLALFVGGGVLGCSGTVAPMDGSTADVAIDARSDATPTDVPNEAAVACGTTPSFFPTFRRDCTADSDCTVAVHQTDCCGNSDGFGLRASERTAFDAAEATCRSMYPGCGCPSFGIRVESGPVRVFSATELTAVCRSGMCLATTVTPPTCMNTMCSPGQTCVEGCCGVPGCTPSPARCVDVPAACATNPSCSCFPEDPCAGGSCVEFRNGQVTCVCA